MSTSSLEQAILKISKVMEDFVGEQQKINSHLNEKIDNMESSINGKRKLPPQPHHNLQGTNAKRSRKVLMIDTLVGDCYDNSMDQPSIENHKVQDDKGLLEPFKASTSPGMRRETNSLGPNGKDANFVWDPGGVQHEVGVSVFSSSNAKVLHFSQHLFRSTNFNLAFTKPKPQAKHSSHVFFKENPLPPIAG
ncbi:hypothetical protein AAG906_022155 [Vitis piasezkii]